MASPEILCHHCARTLGMQRQKVTTMNGMWEGCNGSYRMGPKVCCTVQAVAPAGVLELVSGVRCAPHHC